MESNMMETAMLSPERLSDLAPLSSAAADYGVVRRAIAHIKGNWRDQPEIEQIAEAAGVTPTELHHLFRRWAGLTPKAFLQALTLDSARQLLRVETFSASLPGVFWQDYANCAGVTNMPVHAVRAYDNAKSAADGTPNDAQLEQIARNRLKQSDTTASYPAKKAWYAQQTGDRVRFTSTLCGESLTAKANSPVNVYDVSKGSCTVIITSEKYPTRDGNATASLLVLTQMPREAESLEAYSQRMLKDPRYAGKTPLTGVPCPVATCLTFEIITDKLYKSEGGGHLIAVFFQSEQPTYPGLRFETPQPLPKTPSGSSEPTFYRADETLNASEPLCTPS